MLNGTGNWLGFCEKGAEIAKLCEDAALKRLVGVSKIDLAFHFGKKFIQRNDLCIAFLT